MKTGNTKERSITVPLTSCLTGLDQSVLQIKTNIVSCQTADSKPVKQEVNGTVVLLPLVFAGEDGFKCECESVYDSYAVLEWWICRQNDRQNDSTK